MKVKTVNTRYVVRFDGLDKKTFNSRKEANLFVSSLQGTSLTVKRIDVVRQNMVEIHVNTYVPKTTTVFVASELGNDLGVVDNANTDETNPAN